MSKIEELLTQDPFALSFVDRDVLFLDAMKEAFLHHMANNPQFKNLCDNQNFSDVSAVTSITQLPYLPVKLFKKKELHSVPKEKIKVTLHSSATSGVPSVIGIDEITSRRQALVSMKIMSSYLGSHRRPFFVLDENPLKAKSAEISARSAAARGFLMFANDIDYFVTAAEDTLTLDIKKFEKKLAAFDGKEICIFGFTFILYKCLVEVMKKQGNKFHLHEDSKIVHIGGWKKLEDSKVDKETFLQDIAETFGMRRENIIDFYGFTEQMGLVYASCGAQSKTTSLFSEVIIRDFQTLQPLEDGREGLIQIVTPIPNSYPGISVLTEDVGRVLSREQDADGRWGTQFEVIGRAKKAEVRGCGDVMAESVA